MAAPPTSPSRTSFGRKVLRWTVANPILAVILVIAGVAAATITITYTTSSTLTTSVTPPPIQILAGDDTGSLSDYVTAFGISTNKTYVTSTVKGVPEATLSIPSYFKIENVDDVDHTVTLSTPNVANALVTAYTIEILDGATSKDTLDLLDAADPTTAQFTLPAGSTYTAKLTLTLDSGAGANNVALTNAVTLTFT